MVRGDQPLTEPADPAGPPRGRLLVGTSGFAYRAWVGEFYPPRIRSADMLEFYAGRFPAVEINGTFLRVPSEQVLDQWAERTPEGFVFALKAPRWINHAVRTIGVDEALELFLGRVARLGTRLGPVLIQCQANLRCDVERLDGFLRVLPPGAFAMEFRHPSWDNGEVRDRLAAGGVAWCVSDHDGDALPGPPRAEGASFAYLRLRRSDYRDDDLAAWAGWVGETLAAGRDVYAFLKHEDTAAGTRWAAALQRMVAP